MIGRADLDGSNPDYALTSADTYWLAADDEHIYWSNHPPDSHAFGAGSSIGRANVDGTGVDPTFIPQPVDSVYGVAADAKHVYWIRWSGRLGDATIARANLDGTGVDPTFIDPKFGSGEPNPLAADSSHLYWEASGGIARANPDGTGARLLVAGASTAVAVNSSHIYWARPALRAFALHKPIRHKRRGTATLPLDVFGPGELLLNGKGLQTVTRTIESNSVLEKLHVKPKGRTKRRLERRGHVKVTAEVTFTLTGADPTTRSKSFRLVRR